MENTINITITLENGLPVMTTDQLTIGTIGDGNYTTLKFDCPVETDNLRMLLKLKPGYGWQKWSIGLDRAFTLPASLMRKNDLWLQVEFYEGETLHANTDILKFKLRPGQSGCCCEDPFEGAVEYLLTEAVTQVGTVTTNTTLPGEEAAVSVTKRPTPGGNAMDFTFSLPTGVQGPQGEQGAQGEQGMQGEQGYTPQRGIDYWTQEDQEAMHQDVADTVDEKVGDLNTLLEEYLNLQIGLNDILQTYLNTEVV